MYLGFDTSNYTTSVALFDGENVFQSKKLLKVKSGERGLRQSDAVFQHTVNMPKILAELEYDSFKLKAVGVSEILTAVICLVLQSETAWQMQFQNLQMHRFIQHHTK